MTRFTAALFLAMLTGCLATAPAWATGSDGFANVSATPLTIPAVRSESPASASTLVIQAHARVLRPAPLPDEDVAPPGPTLETLAAQQDPSLSPGFFNPQDHFSGDGFARGSAIEGDQNHRHTTGGGMNLSIPMQ